MAPDFERLTVTVAPVARVTLTRPEKRNALDRQMLAELTRAAQLLAADDGVRVIVISGSGPDFCAGVDLEEAATVRAQGESAFTDYVGEGDAAMEAVEGLAAVTIAAVHGRCIGAGMVLAAACDLRIASMEASLSMPEASLGFPVMWGGIPRLLRHASPGVVKDMVLTGRPLEAQDALRVGFVNRVAPTGLLEPAAEAWAADLAATPGSALLSAKRMIDRAMQGRLTSDDELAEALLILWPDEGASGDE